MKCKFSFLFILLCFFCFNKAISQIYKNASIPDSIRIEDLISRMTDEEKFRQLFMIPGDPFHDTLLYRAGLFGFQVNTQSKDMEAAGQLLNRDGGNSASETAEMINRIQRFFLNDSRLGIPVIPFDEALHGLVRKGATSFPQAIGLAASWNTNLMHSVGLAIALECKTRGIRQVLSPVVNVATDVRWGRTEETYGEDPFLVSEMAVAFITAFEQNGLIATPKHFVANVGDGGRDSYPVHFSERYMRELHFPPFEASIRRAGARSVMTAYNSYDGLPATANEYLLNQILKQEWGFGGFVISDAGATGGANVLHYTAADYADATEKSLSSGLDVIFQTDIDHEVLFKPPFLDQSLDSSVVDAAVRRVLKAKFELGLFDDPYVDPEKAAKENGKAEHRELARTAALESIVLLKNNHQLLPIGNSVKKIALLGPEMAGTSLGGYSGPGNQLIDILGGMRKMAGDSIQMVYSPACLRTEQAFVTIPAANLFHDVGHGREPGLWGAYFAQLEPKGKPAFERADAVVDFRWTLFSPDPDLLGSAGYSVEWRGYVVSDTSGLFHLAVDGNDGFMLWLNDSLVIDNQIPRGRSFLKVPFRFEAGKAVGIRITFSEPRGNAWFRLLWDQNGIVTDQHTFDEALKLAANSDLVVIATGITEGEFQDRARLSLPGRQEELIQKVAATGKPVVILLVGGSAVTMENWLDEVEAVLAVWYPGEAGGEAIASVLFGQYNPAGRLPVTFPRFEGQLPLVYNHKPTGRGDDYVDMSGQPLFPFGFGLSYTQFTYSDLKISSEKMQMADSVMLSFTVKNTGKCSGDEVVQLYIRDELASVARPVIELKGFQRIHLQPGESREVRFEILPEMLEMLDEKLTRLVEPGIFTLMVGASSRDIRLRGLLEVIE